MRTSTNAAVYLRGLNRGLRDRFSATCRRRGKTMTEVIKDFMLHYCKNNGKMDLKRKDK